LSTLLLGIVLGALISSGIVFPLVGLITQVLDQRRPPVPPAPGVTPLSYFGAFEARIVDVVVAGDSVLIAIDEMGSGLPIRHIHALELAGSEIVDRLEKWRATDEALALVVDNDGAQRLWGPGCREGIRLITVDA